MFRARNQPHLHLPPGYIGVEYKYEHVFWGHKYNATHEFTTWILVFLFCNGMSLFSLSLSLSNRLDLFGNNFVIGFSVYANHSKYQNIDC